MCGARRWRWGFSPVLLLTTLLTSASIFAAPPPAGPTSGDTAPAPPPSKQACVDAATRGQIQRDDSKLGAAAEAFAVCAATSCPPAVRNSCAEWLTAVRASIPTVTIRMAEDTDANANANANARAIVPTRVSIDEKETSLGTPTSLDPGPHVVRVEANGMAPLSTEFSLKAGEAKTIDVRFPIEHVQPSPTTRPTPTLVWILGGVSIVGAASWVTFGLSAKSKTDRLTEECAPACSHDDRDSAFRLAAIADVSLAIGIAAAAAAVVVYVTRPSRPVVTAGTLPTGIAF